MVAQHPDRPGPSPRSLSPDVEDQLALALANALSGKNLTVDPGLQAALEAAAKEARQRSLLPEDLVLSFKKLEVRIDSRAHGDESARVALRTRIIRALLEAYYAS